MLLTSSETFAAATTHDKFRTHARCTLKYHVEPALVSPRHIQVDRVVHILKDGAIGAGGEQAGREGATAGRQRVGVCHRRRLSLQRKGAVSGRNVARWHREDACREQAQAVRRWIADAAYFALAAPHVEVDTDKSWSRYCGQLPALICRCTRAVTHPRRSAPQRGA